MLESFQKFSVVLWFAFGNGYIFALVIEDKLKY